MGDSSESEDIVIEELLDSMLDIHDAVTSEFAIHGLMNTSYSANFVECVSQHLNAVRLSKSGQDFMVFQETDESEYEMDKEKSQP